MRVCWSNYIKLSKLLIFSAFSWLISLYPIRFAVKIPTGLAPEQAAPLLCAGVTVYSPLKHFGLMQPGLRGAILGLGGVGHMGVKVAKAMGHHVTVISSSGKKKAEAMDHLGADAYLVSSDAAQMAAAADSLDYIIDTVPVFHPLEPYLSLLKLDGKLILLGVINEPLQFVSPMVMLGEYVHTMRYVTYIYVCCSYDTMLTRFNLIENKHIGRNRSAGN